MKTLATSQYQVLRNAYDAAFRRLTAARKAGIEAVQVEAEYRRRRDELCHLLLTARSQDQPASTAEAVECPAWKAAAYSRSNACAISPP